MCPFVGKRPQQVEWRFLSDELKCYVALISTIQVKKLVISIISISFGKLKELQLDKK